MSESSSTRADRVSASAKKKKKNSISSSSTNARANSNKRGSKSDGGGYARDDHLSPTDAGDSDDEYDRSKVVFKTNSSPFECGDSSDIGNLNGPSGTRVKLLWKDIKEEDDDGENPVGRRSKSNNSKSARAQKPKSPPVPRAIQKRASAKPTCPQPSLVSTPAGTQSGIFGGSHQDLLERILEWEEELKSSFNDTLAPPAHSIKSGVGSDSLPMAFRKACAEIIKRYPQSANKMSIDKRLWVSWYKEIDALQGFLRSGGAINNTAARSLLPGKKDEATTCKLQVLLASCTEFYSRLVVELRMMYQHQRHLSNNNNTQKQQHQQLLHAIRFSLHMSLVALGDTARYAQKVPPNHHGHDWSIAQQHYERALEFLPSNGKVYNQLALLAMAQGQALKSVYLYVRSLACETPFSSRENLVHALKKGKAKRVDERTHCCSIAEVQERVGALLLSCVDGLFSGPVLTMETGDDDETWDTNTSSLLGGLRYYLETCTSMLLAGNRLDLENVRSGLNQIVCVLIFFAHYFQMPSTSARHLSRSDFDQEMTDWRMNSRIQRLLPLGFAVATCFMKECAKAVLTSEYMVVAKDLMNMLLPPISIYLDWLRAHPWFLESKGGSSVAAADFLSCTVNLLFSISASLLTDRILDEDMSAMSEKRLPEDRELLGFLPINKSNKPTTSDTDENNDGDDEMLLDVRMCRILGFSDDFLRLNGKVPTSQVSWKLQERSTPSGYVSYGLIVFEPSLEPTSTIPELGCNVVTDSNDIDEVAILSDLLLKSSMIASKSLSSSSSTDGVVKAKTPKQGARRGSHPQRRTSPRESITSASSSPPENSRGFAAVMAIGANKKLYDASANPQSPVQKCLIVIDAPNVAMRHGFHKKFSCKGIRLAFDYFLKRGHRVVGFLPDYLIHSDEVDERRRMMSEGADVPAAKIPDDVALLQEMVEERLLIPTPAQDYDDSYCIQYAGMYDGCVVTNDLYRDHVENMTGPRERKVAMRSWLIAHRISYTWVGNEFLPNPNFR